MNRNKKNRFWKIAIRSIPIVLLGWVFINIVFHIIMLGPIDSESVAAGSNAINQPGLVDSLKSLTKIVFPLLFIISIPLTIIGISRVIKNGTGYIEQCFKFGWSWAKKTIFMWMGFFIFMVFINFLGFYSGRFFLEDLTQKSVETLHIEEEHKDTDGEFTDLQDGAGFWFSIKKGMKEGLKENNLMIKPGYESYFFISRILTHSLGIFMSIMILSGLISIIYGKKLLFKSFFSNLNAKKIIHFILGFFVYNLAVFLGCLLFIIPGIIIAIRAKYWHVGVLKNGLGPIDAFKNSWKITRGSFWTLCELSLIGLLIQIPGVLLLFLGLFRTLPTALIADIKMYELLYNAYYGKT